jgi:hypothetical protein
MKTRVLLTRVFFRYQRFAFRLALEWKPADLWRGVYPRRERQFADRWQYDVWVCVVPCLPVHLTWWRGLP